jgi:hypothetical protein
MAMVARRAEAAVSQRSTRTLLKRSRPEWALRGCLAVGALALGAVSIMQALGFVVAGTDPSSGYALAPGDGRIAGRYAERQIAETGKWQPRTALIARNALVDEPIAPAALTAMAIEAQLRSQPGDARRLLVHSDRLSRRNLGTRLLMIEDAVSRGNIVDALYHYDVALRTSRNAFDTLFPVLSSALGDPAIVPAMADLLVKQPPWGESFLRYVLTSPAELDPLASLFNALIDRGLRVPGDVMAKLVDTFATRGAVANAWSFYGRSRTRLDPRRSRDPDFSAQHSDSTIFDWTPVLSEAGIAASIQRTADGGVFEFSAAPTVGGIVLQQMQVLPAGRYRLRGQTADINQSSSARPYWALVCTDAREIGRVDLDAAGRFDGVFDVRDDCPAQLLRLIARPSSAVDGVSGRVERAILQPVGITL